MRVNVTPRPHLTPGKDPVPIVQEAGWASGPVWTGAENLAPAGIRSPDRPARRQSLYRLRYPAHSQYINCCIIQLLNYILISGICGRTGGILPCRLNMCGEQTSYTGSYSMCGEQTSYTGSYSMCGEQTSYTGSYSMCGKQTSYTGTYSMCGEQNSYTGSYSMCGEQTSYTGSYSMCGEQTSYTGTYSMCGEQNSYTGS